MTKKIQRLTTLAVEKCGTAGYHPDGAGLYLQVSKGGGKSWVLPDFKNKKRLHIDRAL